jgi:hypothetical protein
VVTTVAVQALIVTATALVLAAAVGWITLLPLLHAIAHVWLPAVPPGVVAAGALATAGLVGAGMVVPAAALTRHRPVRVVARTS